MIKYVGLVVIYKIIDPHNDLLMNLNGKILSRRRGMFAHGRLKLTMLRTSEGNVSKLVKLNK